MPNGSCIFVVSKKWWNHRRRDEARRGMLISNRSNESAVRHLKAHAQSKVKQLHLPSVGSTSTVKSNQDKSTLRQEEDEIHLPPLSGRKSELDPDSPAKSSRKPNAPTTRRPQGSPGHRPRGGASSKSPPKATFAAARAAKLQFLDQVLTRTQETMTALDGSAKAIQALYAYINDVNTTVQEAHDELSEGASTTKQDEIGTQFKDYQELLHRKAKGVEKLNKTSQHHSSVLLKLLRQWDKIDNIRSPKKRPQLPATSPTKSTVSPEPPAAAATEEMCNQNN